MARARVIRKQERCFVELPAEFMSSAEVELFQLRDGYYLLSMPLGSAAQSSVSGERDEEPRTPSSRDAKPSEDEIAVLQKLQSIKFHDRTPENVAGMLDAHEKETLFRLEKRGWVNLFHGDKYRNGVYNIADKVYPMLKAHTGGSAKPGAAQAPHDTKQDLVPEDGHGSIARNGQLETGNRTQDAAPLPLSHALLVRQGYLVIRDQKDAKMLSEMLKSEMKAGSVVGTKGFDGAFYLVTKDYFERASKSILGSLKEEADVPSIAQGCRLDADGVRAVLQQLAESGEVIEKRKGRYVAV